MFNAGKSQVHSNMRHVSVRILKSVVYFLFTHFYSFICYCCMYYLALIYVRPLVACFVCVCTDPPPPSMAPPPPASMGPPPNMAPPPPPSAANGGPAGVPLVPLGQPLSLMVHSPQGYSPLTSLQGSYIPLQGLLWGLHFSNHNLASSFLSYII